MFPQTRALRPWAVCCAVLALTGSLAAQQEFSTANKQRGKAIVEYRDKTIHALAAYNYSQWNHDSRWLLVQAGISTSDENIIRRDAIALRTPQGRVIPLATQRRLGEDVAHINELLQNAKIHSHDVPSYFEQRDRVEDMRLFRLPFDRVVSNEFIVDRDRVAVGPLFFESPTGAWEDGTYALIVRHAKGTAELPIRLE